MAEVVVVVAMVVVVVGPGVVVPVDVLASDSLEVLVTSVKKYLHILMCGEKMMC